MRALGCACALASLVLPAESFGQAAAAPRREPAARPAGSAVISYEESRGSAIVYLEESGGLVTPALSGAPRRAVPAPATPPAQAAAPAERRPTRLPRNERPASPQVADALGVAPAR